jgi:hypothetical protein
MARSRNIKPSIMDNEQLAELDPLCRLLFVYLWMLADREGRLEDRPKRIAAQALPYDRDADIDAMLARLVSKGFIRRYTVNYVDCIQVINFSKHQNPHVREAASELPAPPDHAEDPVSEIQPQPRHNLGSDESGASHSLGEVEASPRSPDSLIPDSLIPDSNNKRAKARDVFKPPDVDEQVWQDFLAQRKAQRAPITETALRRISDEAEKAGITLGNALEICLQRGWRGFEADWVAKKLTDPQGRVSDAALQTMHNLREYL